MEPKEIDMGVANEVAKLAWRDKMTLQMRVSLLKTLIVCLCIVLVVGAYFAADCLKYAIDRNYDYLDNLVIETVTITETETTSEASAEFDESGNPKAEVKNEMKTGGGN